jgi:hypothetical protein
VQIGSIGLQTDGDWTRLQATLAWEEADLPPTRVHFETPRAYGDGLRARGDAFLLAGFVPAMERGERRIRIEAEVCSDLRDGVRSAMRVLAGWWPHLSEPALEAGGGFRPLAEDVTPRTASTLSGGVDAFATLLWNRRALPRGHFASIRDVFCIFGMNTYDHDPEGPVRERLDDYEERLRRLQPLADSVEATLVPVRTNIRTLAPDFTSWARRSLGAGLAAVAHAFEGRVSRLRVPSTGLGADPTPDGSHPMLDPFYSSAALRVGYDGLWTSRLDKLRLLAGWDAALAVLQPCQQVGLGLATLNCGLCNKCQRTMLELAAIGRLDATAAFPRKAIDVDFVRELRIAQDIDVLYVEECVAPLREGGRPDLARALEERIAAWRALRARAAGRPRSRLRRLRRELWRRLRGPRRPA